MNRRNFIALLGAAPVAVAVAAAPALTAREYIAAENRKTIQSRVGFKGKRVAEKFPELSLEEMDERYFRPYAEAYHKEMLELLDAGRFDSLFYRDPTQVQVIG